MTGFSAKGANKNNEYALKTVALTTIPAFFQHFLFIKPPFIITQKHLYYSLNIGFEYSRRGNYFHARL